MANIELFHGDCLEVMKDIPDKSIDMILCDLPYGTTANNWDKIIDFNILWKHYKRIIKENGAIVLFSQAPFDKKLALSNLQDFRYEWVWVKEQGTGFFNSKKMPLKNHENILVFYKKLPVYNPQMRLGFKAYKTKKGSHGSNYIQRDEGEIITESNGERYPLSTLNFKRDKEKLHPTQKPIELLAYLIKTYTNEGELVLDNCMGSGSTGVAAKNLNRRFIGVELEKKYFDIAEKRINGEIVYKKIEEPELNYKLPGF